MGASGWEYYVPYQELMEPLAGQRWVGRCAVLHDAHGRPQEILFWGFSGD